MSNATVFESREQKLNKDIEDHIETLRAATPLALPDSTAQVSKLYVKKIEGTYDVERAKKDTDNAIDLLYIAYNATPQSEEDIRPKISNIMDGLVKAQQQAELAMRRAMGVADTVLRMVRGTFPDWLDVRNVKGPEDKEGVAEVKVFLKEDILDLAKKIKDKSLSVKTELDSIATTYQGLITETAAATSKSESALANKLKEKAQIQKEINETNAKREQLDELVKDLQLEVAKYDKMARDYESRASTAEERAFVMSIVQIGAQMVASAVPGIVTAATGAATGGMSVVAAAAANTVGRAVGDKNGDGKRDPGDAEVVQTKTKISEKKGEVQASEKKIVELKDKVKGLEKDLADEKKKEQESGKGTGKAADADKGKDDKEKDAGKGKSDEKKEESEAVKALETRVSTAKTELKTEQDKYALLVGALSGLQDSLAALDKGLAKMTEKQENAAASLREMQMKMLDKVETYEKERRTQNAELVKINALLKGKRSEDETIHLAIQALNISITALKRTKEIIQEIGFFFLSFANFMDQVGHEVINDIELFDAFVAKEKVRGESLKNLIKVADQFFLRQNAEWHAITFVSDKFCKSFADGWSKLNKLSGKYIHGSELDAYLKGASQAIEEIVAERDEASKRKLVDLEGYRNQLRSSALA